jgi:hypothetical protein
VEVVVAVEEVEVTLEQEEAAQVVLLEVLVVLHLVGISH